MNKHKRLLAYPSACLDLARLWVVKAAFGRVREGEEEMTPVAGECGQQSVVGGNW